MFHLILFSDYGYDEVPDGSCVPSTWFNPSFPIADCEEGSSYWHSSGLVSLKILIEKRSGFYSLPNISVFLCGVKSGF